MEEVFRQYEKDIRDYATALLAHDMGTDIARIPDGVVDYFIQVAVYGDETTLNDLSDKARSIVAEINWLIDELDEELISQ